MTFRATVLLTSIISVTALAQAPAQPDWAKLQDETMQHFQALLRIDTRNPPGNETVLAEYLKGVLEKEGIPAQIVGSDPKRSNVVARLKGNGKKKPLLIMGHSDVVTVDEAKWKFPPFSATRDGGYVYARGTVDDKDNLTAALMTMLLLKRQNVPLDRDVIFLSEAGEEGSSGLGIGYMVSDQFPADRRGVLHRRRRRRRAHRRRGEVRDRADAGEDPARNRAGGARHLGAWIGAAQVQRHRPPGRRGREGRRLAAGDPLQRDHRQLLPQAGVGVAARGREDLSRRAVHRSERPRKPPTTGCSSTSRAIRRCCAPRCRRTSSTAATART